MTTPRTVLDEVGICNLALRHIGISKKITTLTERSAEGQACADLYGQTRDEVLGDFPWPFATKTVTLALVSDPTIPVSTEWWYSYRYPVDCLRIQRIPTGTGRTETSGERVPYVLGADDDGTLIYTDFAPVAATATTPALPQIVYTATLDDPGRYSVAFAQAVACKLAFYLVPTLTAGDKYGFGKRAAQLYQYQLVQAQANALNEEQSDPLPNSEFILARDS